MLFEQSKLNLKSYVLLIKFMKTKSEKQLRYTFAGECKLINVQKGDNFLVKEKLCTTVNIILRQFSVLILLNRTLLQELSLLSTVRNLSKSCDIQNQFTVCTRSRYHFLFSLACTFFYFSNLNLASHWEFSWWYINKQFTN